MAGCSAPRSGFYVVVSSEIRVTDKCGRLHQYVTVFRNAETGKTFKTTTCGPDGNVGDTILLTKRKR